MAFPFISEEGWLRVKGVHMGINQNISTNCGVREEGCTAMAKQHKHLERLPCNLGWDNKIGVTGYRLGVADKTNYGWKHRKKISDMYTLNHLSNEFCFLSFVVQSVL